MRPPGNRPRRSRTSPNANSREGCQVALAVLHYTGMETAEAALDRLCDPCSRVSAHYLIDPRGCVHELVPERLCAWHAGKSFWAGRRNLNAASIGVELAHPGHLGGERAYPVAQIEALEELLQEISRRWQLSPGAVLGHSDIAPTRKRDPGEWFPWQRLALKGLAAWSPGSRVRGDGTVDGEAQGRMVDALKRIGYEVAGGDFAQPVALASLRAFQRRFRPLDLGLALSPEAVIHAERVAAEWPGKAVFATGAPDSILGSRPASVLASIPRQP